MILLSSNSWHQGDRRKERSLLEPLADDALTPPRDSTPWRWWNNRRPRKLCQVRRGREIRQPLHRMERRSLAPQELDYTQSGPARRYHGKAQSSGVEPKS
ncbi:hypothetical protein P8452_12331 [Trifolium repens]|nr:hypothetical protein QL285_007454 [Trifolium repens]WJX23086.1 hypothetical protein P8452_12331 [Trifolium repens]